MKRFYKTTVTVEILSEEPIGDPSLSTINYQIMEGDWSGRYNVTNVQELDEQEVRIALEKQGSDPDFFILGDCED